MDEISSIGIYPVLHRTNCEEKNDARFIFSCGSLKADIIPRYMTILTEMQKYVELLD